MERNSRSIDGQDHRLTLLVHVDLRRQHQNSYHDRTNPSILYVSRQLFFPPVTLVPLDRLVLSVRFSASPILPLLETCLLSGGMKSLLIRLDLVCGGGHGDASEKINVKRVEGGWIFVMKCHDAHCTATRRMARNQKWVARWVANHGDGGDLRQFPPPLLKVDTPFDPSQLDLIRTAT